MRKLRIIAVFCLTAVLLGGMAAYAATNYGTESDPLITLSYLNSVLKPELEQKYNQQTKDSIAALESRVEAMSEGSYGSVSLKADQTLTCKAGCEILLRDGQAYVTENILDITAGEVKENKAWLEPHHLYMATADGAAIRANSNLYLMVRGEYTIS